MRASRNVGDSAGVQYLTPADLVARWNGAVTTGPLANWRCAGRGPAFVKLGHRTVRYALADVARFERANKRPDGKKNDRHHR